LAYEGLVRFAKVSTFQNKFPSLKSSLDVPGALDSSSSEEEHNSELISKYQFKAK
jgi:hypothetical protein